MMGLRIDVRIRWWAHCYPSKCSLSLSLTVALALAHFFRTRFRGASIYLMWAPHRAFIYDSSLDAPNNANHRHREPYTYENTFQYAYQVVFWAFRYQEVANQLARSDIYDFILSKWERERQMPMFIVMKRNVCQMQMSMNFSLLAFAKYRTFWI